MKMPKKTDERIIVERLYLHMKKSGLKINIHDVAEIYFGLDRRKVTFLLRNIKDAER
jgi:hypothetical protein